MKKVAIVVVLIILSITNVNAASKVAMKKYAKIYIATKYGWNNEEFEALEKLVQKESSWNAKVVNKYSGACGLFQAYPCSKMRKYGKNYRTNYKVQIKFGTDYIKKRYDTPKKAWSFWLQHHWY
jgi:hypothetical protein